MKQAVFCVRMYDPVAKELWWEPHVVRYNTKAEFKAEVAKIKARYQIWTGEVPRG